ncbi:MAG: polymerase subunit sigma-70 [Chlorobi bacterium]|nr:polymerase subunit sigma-70 [Chlorobiota bacterium]
MSVLPSPAMVWDDEQSFGEEELIEMIRNRQKKALGILYDRYSSALYIAVIRIVRTRECAEDVLQEAFVKIWIHAGQFDPSRGKLYTWMINIARNLAIDKVKSKGFREGQMNQEIGSVLHIVDQKCNTTFNSDKVLVRELVGALNPRLKEIIELVYFQGYTQVEASTRLGIPIGTAKTRLRMALRTIRVAFG